MPKGRSLKQRSVYRKAAQKANLSIAAKFQNGVKFPLLGKFYSMASLEPIRDAQKSFGTAIGVKFSSKYEKFQSLFKKLLFEK